MERTSEGREPVPGEGMRLLGKPHSMSTGSYVHVSQCGGVLADFKMVAVRSPSLWPDHDERSGITVMNEDVAFLCDFVREAIADGRYVPARRAHPSA